MPQLCTGGQGCGSSEQVSRFRSVTILEKTSERTRGEAPFTHTQYHLARLIPAYLMGRGRIKFINLGNSVRLDGGMPRGIRQAGHRQDCIGWRHFTEGKISLGIREVQEYYLALLPTTELTIDSWMKGLIAKLVAMTHSQWIYRNITKPWNHPSRGKEANSSGD